jgi:hypothetical protein
MASKAVVRLVRGVANPWAPRIQAALRKSIDGVLEAGRLLKLAREDLPKDEFEAMLRRDLGLGLRAAQMLIKIGADHRVANYSSRLPPNWTTLHHLTKLDDRAFEAGIKNGVITPSLQQKEAGGLVGRTQRMQRARRAASQNVGSLFWCSAEKSCLRAPSRRSLGVVGALSAIWTFAPMNDHGAVCEWYCSQRKF